MRQVKKIEQQIDAYLDIETTGLNPNYSQITVVGICVTNGIVDKFLQLVGDDITADRLLDSLDSVSTIYT